MNWKIKMTKTQLKYTALGAGSFLITAIAPTVSIYEVENVRAEVINLTESLENYASTKSDLNDEIEYMREEMASIENVMYENQKLIDKVTGKDRSINRLQTQIQGVEEEIAEQARQREEEARRLAEEARQRAEEEARRLAEEARQREAEQARRREAERQRQEQAAAGNRRVYVIQGGRLIHPSRNCPRLAHTPARRIYSLTYDQARATGRRRCQYW